MWMPSQGIISNLVSMEGVLNESHLYPKDVIDALNELKKENKKFSHKMYSIPGYIIQRDGWVGIHPNADESDKKEWIEYWQRKKDNPLFDE